MAENEDEDEDEKGKEKGVQGKQSSVCAPSLSF